MDTSLHAHGGVLIMMSILYYMFLDRTTLSTWTKRDSSLTLLVGIGGLVSGFLLHAITGQPWTNRGTNNSEPPSTGNPHPDARDLDAFPH
jgi:hypothetical protein